MAMFFKLLHNRIFSPKPSHASFTGQTILITAATGGLGLEAAKKLAASGTTTLIITARDSKKGATAKATIETYLNSLHPNPNPSITIIPLVLEMSEPTSVLALVTTLKSHTRHLDHAILNAGIFPSKHSLSPSTPYESTFQINILSTTYLSLLLIPLLLASPLTTQPHPESRPHLTTISSGFATTTPLAPLTAHQTPIYSLSQPSHFSGGPTGQQYARSKLFLEYCIRHIAFLPSLLSDPDNPKSAPKVIATTACPGACRSDLGRSVLTDLPYWATLIAKPFMFIIQRAASDGANTYITSLEQGLEARGELWKDDRFHIVEARTNIKSEEGLKVGERVWREAKGAIGEWDGEGGAAIRVLGDDWVAQMVMSEVK